jgi:PEP-CTERM motif
MKTFINQRKTLTYAALAAALLGLGAIQAQAQSVLYNFADNTSDGWAVGGFGSTPAATVATIGGQNYIALSVNGNSFQVGNVGAGAGSLFTAMAAAWANPSGYQVTYNYSINTASFSGATFLQLGTFVNGGSGYYVQDFGAQELQLSGAQLSSGSVLTGTVTVPFTVFNPGADLNTETFYRLGLIENTTGGATGVVDFTGISVSPTATPEPASLALAGLGGLSMLFLRRRKA